MALPQGVSTLNLFTGTVVAYIGESQSKWAASKCNRLARTWAHHMGTEFTALYEHMIPRLLPSMTHALKDGR